MAHSGGQKFASVNLNRTYGSQQPGSGSAAAAVHGNRSYGAGRGGGGGMVVLSRSRTGALIGSKTSPRLSVPPPLNLPSLRKENERFDPAASGPVQGRGGLALGAGTGGPGTSGWIKPTSSAADVSRSGAPIQLPPEKSVTLKGEDFPSLQASVLSTSSTKHKDTGNHVQNQKHLVGGGGSETHDHRPTTFGLGLRSHEQQHAMDMRPQVGTVSSRPVSGSVQKAAEFSGPLPVVRLQHTSDWADDERDTGLSLPERNRHKDHDLAVDGNVINRVSHDGPWRATDNRPESMGKETVRSLPHRDNAASGGMKDSWYARRDTPLQNFHVNVVEESNRGSNSWGISFQNRNFVSKSQFSSPGKGILSNNLVGNNSRDARPPSNLSKAYMEDPSLDAPDPLDLDIKMLKKKKEMPKQMDFHDPDRELFEAEVNSILRAKEQERQWEMEEKARALEMARKEKEERLRLIREEEERKQLIEEAARRAAWLAEKERIEAAKRTEELRNAREEEKRRILLEEERRKEAARQKLLELEARMSRRETEEMTEREAQLPSASKTASSLESKAVDVSRVSSAEDGENGGKTSQWFSAPMPSNSSSMHNYNGASPVDSSEPGSRDAKNFNMERSEHSSYGPRASFQSQEFVHRGVGRNSFGAKKTFTKKDSHDHSGILSIRPSPNDDYSNSRAQRWGMRKENDPFARPSQMDSEIVASDRFGDVGWLLNNPEGSSQSQYEERQLQSPDDNGYSTFAKPRNSLRQPRVLPPPSVSSIPRSYRAGTTHPSSSFMDNEVQYHHGGVLEEQIASIQYGSSYQDPVRMPGETGVVGENAPRLEDRESFRHDSVSSLSVPSSPSSPTHVAHDEMDVSGDSPALPTSADGDQTLALENEYMVSTLDFIGPDKRSSNQLPDGGDDNWPSDNNDEIPQQDGYHDNDEYDEIDGDNEDECDDENFNLDEELAVLNLNSACEDVEQTILGFDDGIQVEIPSSSDPEYASLNTEKMILLQECSSEHVHEQRSNQDMAFPEILSSVSNIISKMGKAIDDPDHLPGTSSANSGSPKFSLAAPSQEKAISESCFPASSSGTPVISLCSTSMSQNDVPISLQFGLLSGHQLIPRPIAAIQIGSIQLPIHFHPQISPLSQMHPSDAPLFQFGQLRYKPPVAQNVTPLPAQNVSYGRPPMATPYMLNPIHPGHVNPNSSQMITQGKVPYSSVEKCSGTAAANCRFSKISSNSQLQNVTSQQSNIHEAVEQKKDGAETRNHDISSRRNFKLADSKSVELISYRNISNVPKTAGPRYRDRGRRYDPDSHNFRSRFSSSMHEPNQRLRTELQRRNRRNFHKTEFRVRETGYRKKNHNDGDRPNSNTSDVPVSNVNRTEEDAGKLYDPLDEQNDTSSGRSTSHSAKFGGKTSRPATKDTTSSSSVSVDKVHSGQLNAMSSVTKGDSDFPQRGVVQVSQQHGIEFPSDADGFIEVKSKKQMLNVRRKQREKESKSKSRIPKTLRRSTPTIRTSNANANRATVSSVAESSNFSRPNELGGVKSAYSPSPTEPSTINNNQIPTSNATNLPLQVSAISTVVKSVAPVSLFSGNMAISNHTGLAPWDVQSVNVQVVPFSQTQMEEAMPPLPLQKKAGTCFSFEEQAMGSQMAQEKLFTSSAGSVSSSIVGEKIQFGAATSPGMISSVLRANAFGAPGSSRPEIKVDSRLPPAQNDSVGFFDKAKGTEESCRNLEEAEAEAAASAVAVAAITSDEIVNHQNNLIAVSPVGTKIVNADISGATRGVVTFHDQSSQSAVEESLRISLPADLSVDTQSISIWPPLPSPHATAPMPSQFHRLQPSQFSCFDMNPVFGGQLFAFRPPGESGSMQPNSQRNNLTAAQLGLEPQFLSGMDQFYRPPAGFTSPFISPGTNPRILGAPMFVYNHFPSAPYGQVTMSFLPNTFIPPENQPDIKNQNIVSGQSNAASVTASVQQVLPSSSPHMPLQSPLTMFDISPLQPSPDVPVQACWSHLPAHASLSVPLHQHQLAGGLPSHSLRNMPMDNVSGTSAFQEPRQPLQSDGNMSCSSSNTVCLTERGAAEQPAPKTSPQPMLVSGGLSAKKDERTSRCIADGSLAETFNGTGTQTVCQDTNNNEPLLRPPPPPPSSMSNHQHRNADRRARNNHKTGPSNDWHHRQHSYDGKRRNSSEQRGFHSGRMKQIYVAKPTSSASVPPATQD